MNSLILRQTLAQCRNGTFTRPFIGSSHFRFKQNSCQFSTSKAFRVGYQIKDSLTDCYNLLNVSEECTSEELKEAYFKMAKIYHPDSQTSTADPKKFDQIKQAYKAIKQQRKGEASEHVLHQYDDDDDDDFGFKQHQAQHRQFLDNEGFGLGSRSERHKQYEQMKVSRAQHNIYKYKVKKIMSDGENAVVEKEKKIAKKNKMRY